MVLVLVLLLVVLVGVSAPTTDSWWKEDRRGGAPLRRGDDLKSEKIMLNNKKITKIYNENRGKR
jgi:hypothetical protein